MFTVDYIQKLLKIDSLKQHLICKDTITVHWNLLSSTSLGLRWYWITTNAGLFMELLSMD